MNEREPGAFAPGVGAWIRGVGSVRDAVRQAVVSRQLAAHLPGEGSALEVLAGCGQGTQAVLLARLGHRVTGVDLSDQLLAEAERSRESEPEDVARRLVFERGNVLDLGEPRRGRYDVVCCHGVAMYLPSLGELVTELVAAARSGGVVSLLTRNRAGIAMRAGMTGHWRAAMDGQLPMRVACYLVASTALCLAQGELWSASGLVGLALTLCALAGLGTLVARALPTRRVLEQALVAYEPEWKWPPWK